MIELKDIEKLAELSRIRVSDEEKEVFQRDLGSILGFVDQIKDVAGKADIKMTQSENGLKNVFREDANPHISGQFTEDLLGCVQEKEDGYVKVKKIL